MQHRHFNKNNHKQELHAKNKWKDLQIQRKFQEKHDAKYHLPPHCPIEKPEHIKRAGIFLLSLVALASVIQVINTINKNVSTPSKPTVKKAKNNRSSSFFAEAKEITAENLNLNQTFTEESVGSALYRHILPFLDEKGHFSAETISMALKDAHASNPGIKGQIINLFNSVHAGGNGPITPFTNLSQHVHMGTARIWDENGSFNEKNWQRLLDYAKEKDHMPNMIYQTTLESFIEMINKEHGTQPGTGRDSHIPGGIAAQKFAGGAARQQLFDLVGEKDSTDRVFISKESLELFYRDTGALWGTIKEKINNDEYQKSLQNDLAMLDDTVDKTRQGLRLK